ncbi:MAG TPA: Fic/DOC family N-terminal domain-containing protein [Steroidobacteraceae bacterium]|nr:Fic/DOC family N-terminal domain-containing protein [Steroidobacteraceae bacterium]
MDAERFDQKLPGSLVPITGPDWAFVPHNIPRRVLVPSDVMPLLLEAHRALARLDGAGRYLPGNSILLRPLQRREALRSSALEGTFATAEELLAYGLEPKAPTSSADPTNAWREVFNYDRALQQGQELLEQLPLSSRVIRSIHATLLDGVRGTDRTPGHFRKRQVHIGSDRRFVPPPPDKVEDLIADLEAYMNESLETDCLIQSFIAHYQFETIHPFLDGNGRVGRLLLSLMIYKRCGLQSPWLYLSPFFDKHKDEYIDGLFNVSTRADWSTWIKLCLRGTIAEATSALARVDKLLKIKAEYDKRVLAAPRTSARLPRIVTYLLGSPLVTISEVMKQCATTFPTAKKDVEKLVALGILSESARSARPTYYMAHEYFGAAYMDE